MSILLIFVRAFHFSACLIPLSVFAVVSLVAIPAWNQADETASPDLKGLDRQLSRLLAICLASAFFSGFLWLWFSTAGMTGSSLSDSIQPSVLWTVLTETPPGHAWAAHGCIGCLLLIALHFFSKTESRWRALSIPLRICALLSIMLAASLAWLGHAGAGEGALQNLELGGDIVHLIAAGIWPAGLLPFALFLKVHIQSRQATLIFAASIATRRFSIVSLCAVAALALSGAANSYFMVGNLQALISTGYGRVLLVKLALFSAAIGIGAWNLFKLKPQLPDHDFVASDLHSNIVLDKIQRNILIECYLAALILLIVGLLGLLPPAVNGLWFMVYSLWQEWLRQE
jgi:putative copper resistance protein D